MLPYFTFSLRDAQKPAESCAKLHPMLVMLKPITIPKPAVATRIHVLLPSGLVSRNVLILHKKAA